MADLGDTIYKPSFYDTLFIKKNNSGSVYKLTFRKEW
jgi:hypothetical protein